MLLGGFIMGELIFLNEHNEVKEAIEHDKQDMLNMLDTIRKVVEDGEAVSLYIGCALTDNTSISWSSGRFNYNQRARLISELHDEQCAHALDLLDD